MDDQSNYPSDVDAALSDRDLGQIQGGATDYLLELEGVKGQGSRAITFVGGWGSSMYQYAY